MNNKITIINIDQGIETLRSTIDKDTLVKAVSNGALPEELLVFNNISTTNSNVVSSENKYLYPNFYWEIKPHLLTTSLGFFAALNPQLKFLLNAFAGVTVPSISLVLSFS